MNRLLHAFHHPAGWRPSTAAAVVVMSGMFWLLRASGPGAAAGEPTTPVGPSPELHGSIVEKGVQYLLSQGQAEDGSFSAQAGSGPTSLAITALLRSGRAAKDPAVAKGLKYLAGCARSDGGVYSESSFTRNYETSAAIMCFQAAARGEADRELLRKAEAFVRGIQFDEETGKARSELEYGGVGYGGDSRPDLSNTAFLLDALKSCGAGAEDEAIQQALVFVSRCQNLETEHNTTQFAAKVGDGGFYYTCMLDRQDSSRQTPNGGLRSYGSMSYTGLKSMVYAGLKEDDPRVKAAVGWIRKFYSVETNPGMGSAGLYYYYHTFAKTLDVLGRDTIEDAEGIKHDWRRELTEQLGKLQAANGSWVNTDTRWMEGDPNLVTAYALLALSHCRQPRAQREQ